MQSRTFLRNEAIALLSRLAQVRPFSASMPMVWAATVSDEAMGAIEQHLTKVKVGLRAAVMEFAQSLSAAENAGEPPDVLQGRFVLLKLRFNNLLDQLDIFADVLAQRSEHGTGVWMAGLDAVAEDALQVAQGKEALPPLICFLDRGHGAAIRRARTRLPGGDLNPVAVIQVPRERMVGSGIAPSLIHEVGHQGASLLDLVETMRISIQKASQKNLPQAAAWQLYERWISEIVADCWAMGHLGVGASLGLIGVMSLPRYFVFRISTDGPHPFPWIRVKISLAYGALLFPDAQWARFEALWEQLYPRRGLSDEQQLVLSQLENTLPNLVRLIAGHRSEKLGKGPFASRFPLAARQPVQLRALAELWGETPEKYFSQAPSLAFAVAGQARADGRIAPQAESRLIAQCLEHWAKTTREPGKRSMRPPVRAFLHD